jgi:hypothetical protein
LDAKLILSEAVMESYEIIWNLPGCMVCIS